MRNLRLLIDPERGEIEVCVGERGGVRSDIICEV